MGITVCRFFSTYLIYNPFFLNFPLKVIVLYNKIARPIHTINSDIKLLTLWYKILLIIQTLTYMYTFNHAIMTIKKLLKMCVNCIKFVYSGLITLVCCFFTTKPKSSKIIWLWITSSSMINKVQSVCNMQTIFPAYSSATSAFSHTESHVTAVNNTHMLA